MSAPRWARASASQWDETKTASKSAQTLAAPKVSTKAARSAPRSVETWATTTVESKEMTWDATSGS